MLQVCKFHPRENIEFQFDSIINRFVAVQRCDNSDCLHIRLMGFEPRLDYLQHQ